MGAITWEGEGTSMLRLRREWAWAWFGVRGGGSPLLVLGIGSEKEVDAAIVEELAAWLNNDPEEELLGTASGEKKKKTVQWYWYILKCIYINQYIDICQFIISMSLP